MVYGGRICRTNQEDPMLALSRSMLAAIKIVAINGDLDVMKIPSFGLGGGGGGGWLWNLNF